MSSLPQSSFRNRLLVLMASEAFACLAPCLEPIFLNKGDVLAEMDQAIEFAYFPEDGIASIVIASPDGLVAEAGLFGFEGCGPLPVILGSDRSLQRVVVQMPGVAHRVRREALHDAMERSADLRGLLLRFVQVQAAQSNFTALSNAVHQVDRRLARWLLMCHDRSASDHMQLTHEFLAVMLAVRRPSVTTTLHVLEGGGFIRSERGSVTIRDRRGLEEFARDAYGRPEAEYRRIIGPIGSEVGDVVPG